MRLCGVFATMAAVLLLGKAAPAEDCGKAANGAPSCCAQCGCHVSCQKKVCQVVCGTKKEKKTRWVVKCEDFCAPLPTLLNRCQGGCCGECPSCSGTAACESCTKGGNGCATSGECCAACSKEKPLVPPKCGKVRTKKTLVKEEYEVEVPVYKCVVVYLCDQCCDPGAAGAGECKASAAPPAPKAAPAPTPARTY